MKNCEKECFEKYGKLFKERRNDDLFDFKNFKSELVECSVKCEERYRRVIEHQVKGAEISYVSEFYYSLYLLYLVYLSEAFE